MGKANHLVNPGSRGREVRLKVQSAKVACVSYTQGMVVNHPGGLPLLTTSLQVINKLIL